MVKALAKVVYDKRHEETGTDVAVSGTETDFKERSGQLRWFQKLKISDTSFKYFTVYAKTDDSSADTYDLIKASLSGS